MVDKLADLNDYVHKRTEYPRCFSQQNSSPKTRDKGPINWGCTFE